MAARPLLAEQVYASPLAPLRLAVVVVWLPTAAVFTVSLLAASETEGVAGGARKVTVLLTGFAVPARFVSVTVMETLPALCEVKVMELVEPSDESTPAFPPALVMLPGLATSHE